MARLSLLDPTESDDTEVREWSAKVEMDGHVSNHFRAETNFPEVMMRVFDARLAIARCREIGPELFLKIAVAVSMANRCTYCTGAFCSLLSSRYGSDEDARSFQEALATDELSGTDGDVIDFALSVLDDPHAATDEDFDRLREDHGFSDRGIIGLLYAVNIVDGYNRITITCDLAYDHPYPREWADPEQFHPE